jgi:hypothetical protein
MKIFSKLCKGLGYLTLKLNNLLLDLGLLEQSMLTFILYINLYYYAYKYQ